MKTTSNIRTTIVTITLALACSCATARPRPPHIHHPHKIVTVASVVVTDQIRHNRMMMVLNYLQHHRHITIKHYAQMMHIDQAAAEAELDALARDYRSIAVVRKGNNKVYVKR